MTRRGTRTDGGKYYGVTASGAMHEAAPGEPDVVICRRVIDYPTAQEPVGAGLRACADCGELIAFNPAGPWPNKPHVCMQCRGIEPLPFERTQ